MIYITGDCHGNFERFNSSIFPEQNEMTKKDYVIICGDFGGVWHSGKVHKIRESVLHLMRGRVFEIEEKKIFSFAGPAAMISKGECWNRMIRSLKKSMLH